MKREGLQSNRNLTIGKSETCRLYNLVICKFRSLKVWKFEDLEI